LFKLADTPRKMVKLGEDRVRDLIKTIGLYRTKAKNVVALSRILVEQHGGKVPHDRAALEALAGRRPQDRERGAQCRVRASRPSRLTRTIFRVANRTGLAPGKDPLAVEMKLKRGGAGEISAQCPPLADPARRYVCVARRPLCKVRHRRPVQVAGKTTFTAAVAES